MGSRIINRSLEIESVRCNVCGHSIIKTAMFHHIYEDEAFSCQCMCNDVMSNKSLGHKPWCNSFLKDASVEKRICNCKMTKTQRQKRIADAKRRLKELHTSNEAAWNAYGSELCAGQMIGEEETIEKEIWHLEHPNIPWEPDWTKRRIINKLEDAKSKGFFKSICE